MLILYINVSPIVKTDYSRGFDIGARVGQFDALNGQDVRYFSGVKETDYNAGYIDGYSHAYAAFC